MSEEQAPFTPFTLDTDNAPAAPAKVPAKKPRKNAKKISSAVPLVASTEDSKLARAKPKKPRKPRAAKVPREAKLPLAQILSATAGLKETDAHLLSQMVAALQQVNKGGRKRIVAALGRIFA